VGIYLQTLTSSLDNQEAASGVPGSIPEEGGGKKKGKKGMVSVDPQVPIPGFASVDMLGWRYKSVDFGAKKSPGWQNWWGPK